MGYLTTKLAMVIGVTVIGLISETQAGRVPEGCRQHCADKTCTMGCQQCCAQKWLKPENAQKKNACLARCQRTGKR